MDDGKLLRNRVQELRTLLNLRQANLAVEVDATHQATLAIEKNRINPSIRLSLKFALALGESVDRVFYLEEVSGACESCTGELN